MVVGAVSVIAAITGSGHDFSAETWNSTAGGEICEPCHTPHGAVNNVQAPLWNHTNTTFASFQVYTSATMNVTPGQPDGESIACLSCHDGSVALDSFGGNAGSTTMSGSKLVGTDMRDDHPISFLYSASVSGGDTGLKSGASVSNLLFTGKVQCSSCHDVHNGGSGTTNLLVMSNSGSALCLTCHNK
jgi:predicted CXXCH cytochrome family protein